MIAIFAERASPQIQFGAAALLAAWVCLVAFAQVAHAAESSDLLGEVTRVIDGDTLELTVAHSQVVRIRLGQIDAPEKRQPYGEQATAALTSLTLGKRVRVEVVDVDRYGRSVGEIYLIDGAGDADAKQVHVNGLMVRQGHAWAYTRYAKSAAIIELEDEARQHKRGLWRLPLSQRDPPWEWRRNKTKGRTAKQPSRAVTGPADTVCGAKRTCKEMVSCAEARFYLSQCHLTRLDGDGDGTPCESLCRE